MTRITRILREAIWPACIAARSVAGRRAEPLRRFSLRRRENASSLQPFNGRRSLSTRHSFTRRRVGEGGNASTPKAFASIALQLRAGFTLLELLIVMGIIAVALVALVPAVTSLSKAGGRRAARDWLLGGIEQARAEAIKSGQATYVVFPTFTSGAQSTLDRYNYRSYAIFGDNAASPGNVKQLTDWKSFPSGVALRKAYTINGVNGGLDSFQDPAALTPPVTFSFAPDASAAPFKCIKFNSNGEVQAPITPAKAVYLAVFEGFVSNGSEVATTKDGSGNPSAVDTSWSRNSRDARNRWPPHEACNFFRARSERRGFSLAEVVIALGVITVGFVAVLGVFPAALQTGHSAQDETRAAHIAQSVFGSLVAQARTASGNLNPAATIPSTTTSVDLTSTTHTIYADNNGQLTSSATDGVYAIFIYTNNAPPGFTTVPPTANQVTVRVAWPANAPAANQTFRDYVRIISKYLAAFV